MSNKSSKFAEKAKAEKNVNQQEKDRGLKIYLDNKLKQQKSTMRMADLK